MTTSLYDASLKVNTPLTNIAQGTVQPEFVMKVLYPLVETGDYAGQVITFDDSDYEDVDDTRADDTPYPEIQDTYYGDNYKLNTKGLSYRVGDKKARQMEKLRINWGRRATGKLLARAGLKHEIEAATAATTLGNYSTSNRITLTAGSQISDNSVDPMGIILPGKSAVSGQIGVEPNVMAVGQDAHDWLIRNPYIKEHLFYNGALQRGTANAGTAPAGITEDMLAALFGVRRYIVCRAVRKTAAGVRTRVFGKDIVLAYTNPAALEADRLPYRVTGDIDPETPSYGYTYVYMGNPLVYNPYRDEDRGATVYKMDFDRKVVNTGKDRESGLITHGYLIKNAVA